MDTYKTLGITPETLRQAPTKITRVAFEVFGAVLALKYEKVELKKSFDLFRGGLINYTIR